MSDALLARAEALARRVSDAAWCRDDAPVSVGLRHARPGGLVVGLTGNDLVSGNTGVAVVFASLARLLGSAVWFRRADATLASPRAEIRRRGHETEDLSQLELGYHFGLSGVLYGIQCVRVLKGDSGLEPGVRDFASTCDRWAHTAEAADLRPLTVTLARMDPDAPRAYPRLFESVRSAGAARTPSSRHPQAGTLAATLPTPSWWRAALAGSSEVGDEPTHARLDRLAAIERHARADDPRAALRAVDEALGDLQVAPHLYPSAIFGTCAVVYALLRGLSPELPSLFRPSPLVGIESVAGR